MDPEVFKQLIARDGTESGSKRDGSKRDGSESGSESDDSESDYGSDGYNSGGSGHSDRFRPVTRQLPLHRVRTTDWKPTDLSKIRIALLLGEIRKRIESGKPYDDLLARLFDLCGIAQFMSVMHTNLPSREKWLQVLTPEEFTLLKKVVLNCLLTFLAICEINRGPVLQDVDNYRAMLRSIKTFFHCFDLAGADTRDELLTFIEHIDRVQLIGFIEPDWLVPLMESADSIQRLPSLVYKAIQRLWEPAGLLDDFIPCVLNLIEYAKLTNQKPVLTIWIKGFIRRYCRFNLHDISAETETILSTIFESYINFDLPKVCVAVIKYVRDIRVTESNRWGDGGWDQGRKEGDATCACHIANLIRTIVNSLGLFSQQEFAAVCNLYERMREQYNAVFKVYTALFVKDKISALHIYEGVVNSSKQALVILIERLIDFVFHKVVEHRDRLSRMVVELVDKDETFDMKLISPSIQTWLTSFREVPEQTSAAQTPSPVAP